MTSYDPFAYGQVPLDSKQQVGDESDDHEDLLFAGGDAAKQAPPADGDTWNGNDEAQSGMMSATGEALTNASVAQFGADVLGEQDDEVDDIYGSPMGSRPMSDNPGGASMPDPHDEFAPSGAVEPASPEPIVAGAGAPVAEDKPLPADESVESMAHKRGRRTVRRSKLATTPVKLPEKQYEDTVQARKRRAAAARSRRRPVFATLLPMLLFGGGGATAAWLYMMQQNPVLAGIVAATTVVSSLFSWVLLRG